MNPEYYSYSEGYTTSESDYYSDSENGQIYKKQKFD